MITVRVRDRDVYAIPLWPITTGSVGLPVAFDFDDAWDGLTRIAVFRGSDTDVEVALLTDACVVPPEVLTVAGGNLYIGVYGRDAYGTVVIPTIWGKAGHIYDGTEPEDPDPADPTPEWSYQVQQAAAEALRIAQGVAADAEAGEFDGAPGVSPTVESEEITGGHRITITDVTGDTVVDVMDGTDGRNGTDGINGTDGSDGVSPEVTVTSITGGHRVSITDADHPSGQSFDVMDGASAYEQAVAGGYTGTEQDFNTDLASFKTYAAQTASDATAAAASAYDSEAWAVGERGGVPVGEDDPAYENNAKWYADHGGGGAGYVELTYTGDSFNLRTDEDGGGGDDAATIAAINAI